MKTLRSVRAALALLLGVALVLLGAGLVGDTPAIASWEGRTVLTVGVTEALLLVLVTGVGLVVASYSTRNLQGQPRLARYGLLVLAVVGSLSVAIAASSLVLLAVGWSLASQALAGLVGHDGSTQARQAARLVRTRLVVGDLMLWGSVLVSGLWVGAWDRTALATAVSDAAPWAVSLAALLAVGAAVVRSALAPAHRWLPETAEAPSPVSALLHAGFVNGVGVLALLLWPLVTAAVPARGALVAVGLASVLLGAAQVRTRPDLKGRLAGSTLSQMGYLALQVALGIPAAVVAHLVGHGVWKARKFLGAGGAVQRAREPDAPLLVSRSAVGAVVATVGLAVLALGAAVVPVAGWPALTAPADLLPLLMSVACGALAVVTLQRVASPVLARWLGGAVVGGFVVAYLLGLRGLTVVLEPTLGVPAAWGTTGGWVALAVVTGLVVVGAGWLLVDAAASRGALPALARWVALHSLPPRSPGERVNTRAAITPAVVAVSDESVSQARAHLDVAAAATGALYPLTSFVASNPLSGVEGLGFTAASAVAREVAGAVAGPSAASLRAAMLRGDVRWTDVECALDDVWGAHTGESIPGWPEARLRDAVRSMVLDDDADASRLAQAERALHLAGVPGTREVRTPLEALGDRTLDARTRAFGHHLCARTLAGTGWPGAADPWAELRAHGSRLDALLRVRGAGARVTRLPGDPVAATATMLDQLGVTSADRPLLLARLLARDPGWPGHLRWRVRHAQLGRDAGLPVTDAQDHLPSLVAARLALETIVAEAYAERRLGRPLATPDLIAWTQLPVARLLATDALRGLDLERTPASQVRGLAAVLTPLAAGGLATLRTEVLDRAYRRELLPALSARKHDSAAQVHEREPSAQAQLVFCIDVRSERMRRHLEGRGRWETLGAAGFFGLPVAYRGADGVVSERSPALLRPAATVTERCEAPREAQGTTTGLAHAVANLERNPCLVLGWAEAAGWGLAPALACATSLPARTARFVRGVHERLATPRTGRLDVVSDVGLDPLVGAAADFLTGTGIESTAPLVVLVGHGATVTNNPHVAAYDCGACGGTAGDVSARVMAAALNDAEVRESLRQRGVALATGTWFVAALHDTTTDEVRLLDQELVPTTHLELLEQLERDLETARDGVLQERLPQLPDVPRGGATRHAAARRAADWAQPRPEWGLAGASAIVVGPRSLTRDVDLDGRVFLQSYRPDRDADGSVLASLLEAPVVVAHWITAQYRAATLDPHRFGAGDKTTHNIVGDGVQLAAVVTGARGDLRLGLPWQAVSSRAPHRSRDGSPHCPEDRWVTLPHHVARRLLVVVSADQVLVETALARSPQVTQLVTGAWITLCAVDPGSGVVRRRRPDGSWADEAAGRDDVPADVPVAA